MDNNAPGTCTGMYKVVPATKSLLSKLPTCGPGGRLEIRPMRGGGATPIDPKKGANFNVIPEPKSAVPACSFIRINLKPEYGNSSGRVPPPGANVLTPYGWRNSKRTK